MIKRQRFGVWRRQRFSSGIICSAFFLLATWIILSGKLRQKCLRIFSLIHVNCFLEMVSKWSVSEGKVVPNIKILSRGFLHKRRNVFSPSVKTKHHFQMENNQQFPTPEKGISSQTSLSTASTYLSKMSLLKKLQSNNQTKHRHRRNVTSYHFFDY